MRVMRAVRFLIPLLIVALLVVVGVSVLTARPDLQDAQHAVNATWASLVPDLNGRYFKLENADHQLQSVTGPSRALVSDLDGALSRWTAAQKHGSLAQQVDAANALEAIAQRIAAAPRVQSNVQAHAALTAFSGQAAPSATKAFNDAVVHYHKALQGPIRSVVASAFGYDDVPTFDPPGTSA
jgi:hypothetical protein